MDIELVGNLFMFAGGIGMFLYGMNIMADGMQKSAGSKMKQLIGYLTRNRLLAVLVGAFITAIIQSSGATTVMVVGFVNAGLMTLVQAVGVIMGANIGTTITAWIVSLGQLGDAVKVLKPEFYAPLLVGIGAILVLFSKKPKKKMVGEIIVGIGLLFLGLSFMSQSISPYTDAPIFSKAFEVVGSNPLLGILIGIIVTACMHLLFNIAGAVIFGTAAFILFVLRPSLAVHNITSVEISLFHTFFNIICTTIMMPFGGLLVKLSGMIIREKSQDEENATLEASDSYAAELSRHFDNRILEQPSVAVNRALSEVVIMGNLALDNIKYSSKAVINNDQDMIDKVIETEHKVDLYEKYLTEYLIKVNNLSITEEQHLMINNLFHAIIDIERVSDHAENMADLAKYKIENGITFSQHAMEELKALYEKVVVSFSEAVKAREKLSRIAAENVCRIEDEVDAMEEELRNKHIERLSSGLCKPSNGVIFLDTLSNFERMSDHANNLADCVLEELEQKNR